MMAYYFSVMHGIMCIFGFFYVLQEDEGILSSLIPLYIIDMYDRG